MRRSKRPHGPLRSERRCRVPVQAPACSHELCRGRKVRTTYPSPFPESPHPHWRPRVRTIPSRLGVNDDGFVGCSVRHRVAMRYRAEDPSWEERDRFLLSNSHYAIALYAALIEARIVPEQELETYGSDEGPLPMSGMASYTPGMEMSGGSLGLGLGMAVGMGLGLKRKKSDARVYTLFSDGELGEGSVWEGHPVGGPLQARQSGRHCRRQQSA